MPASPTIAYKILVKTPAPKIHVSKFHEKTPTKNQFNEPRIIIDRAIMFAIIISSPPFIGSSMAIHFGFYSLTLKNNSKPITINSAPSKNFFKHPFFQTQQLSKQLQIVSKSILYSFITPYFSIMSNKTYYYNSQCKTAQKFAQKKTAKRLFYFFSSLHSMSS